MTVASIITGTAAADTLNGTSGIDTIDGGLGADTMTGGLGNDIYFVDNGGDTIIEGAGIGSGIDTVFSTVSYTLDTNVENLVLTGSAVTGFGNSADNFLTGNGNGNVLFGFDGNDTLSGGLGADTMVGGLGNDTYFVDDAGDVVIETGGQGTADLVHSSVDFSIASLGVENITLDGFANVNAIGNASDNILIGNSGNNVLDGGGGTDTMTGGLGNDTYYIDSLTDVYTESAGGGNDTLNFSVSFVTPFTLSNNFENVSFLASFGNQDITGTSSNNILIGNGFDNTITGLGGNDTLDAGNGGNDLLIGGIGNDTYVIYSGNETIVENTNEGNDTIVSSVSYNLNNVINIENLTLANGAGDLQGTGDNGDNILHGNDGNNLILGAGGSDTIYDGGNNGSGDTLIGGTGDDTYYVTTSATTVIESVGEGTDTVISSVDFSLAGQDLENLTLAAGAGYINATGNAYNNLIIGNESANTLDGGTGADLMLGGAGNDTYVMDNAGDLAVESFNQGHDTVYALNISYTLGANIEDLYLGDNNLGSGGTPGINGAFVGTGNEGDNVISNGSNDAPGIGIHAWSILTLDGGDGNDHIQDFGAFNTVTLMGGAGNDLLEESGNMDQQVVMLGGDGNDVLTIGSTGGNFSNVTMDGGAGADTMSNVDAHDTFFGNNSSDVTFFVDNTGDTVIGSDAGNDYVYSSASDFTIDSNTETLTLTGTGDINGTGGSNDNVLTGNSGSNTLDGGAGADTMTGGGGGDTYVVDNAGDRVTGDATDIFGDKIVAEISWSLSNGASTDVHNLTLAAGAGNINATGDDYFNNLIGNEGDNTLDGGANGGGDYMAGGAGNDTYIVDDAEDAVTELVNGGTDTVVTGQFYTLTDNVENLQAVAAYDGVNYYGNELNNVMTAENGYGAVFFGLDGNDILNGGTGDDSLYGGAGCDTLTGGGGADTLDGGTGADTMCATGGNNLFIVDNADDVVHGGAGDTVQASVSYSLYGTGATSLTLTGSASINGTGGDNNDIIHGNSANNTLDGGAGADTMTGCGGTDTYFADNAGDVVHGGSGTDTVYSSVDYNLAATTTGVENLVLTGTAIIGTGDSGNNVITGNAQENILDGGAGADTMAGGAGDDSYTVDNVNDVVNESAGNGFDLIYTSVSYTLKAGSEVEQVSSSGTNDNLTGNELNNILIGDNGDYTLDGGAGADTMHGFGNDVYIVDNSGDIVEGFNSGIGLIKSSVSFDLSNGAQSSGIDNLTLTGTAKINGTGNSDDNVLIGNSAVNTMTGNGGNDTFDGGGGADTMIGGTGNDSYFVDNIKDVINDADGLDHVLSSITYTLAAGLEWLTLTGNAAINGTGNALDNEIDGNSAANILTGGAGNDYLNGHGGADKMLGGTGNDNYIVDNIHQTVTESANAGNDTVQTLVSFTLGANIETLSLVGAGGNINGFGNATANALHGNSGDNTLDGKGGADFMQGGGGNDTYVVDNINDSIDSSGGTGVILSSVSHTMETGITNMTLTGTTAINGTGNTGDNVITGNTGANHLSGNDGNDHLFGLAGNDFLDGGIGNDFLDGGLGHDTLTGGTGADTFHFSGLVSTANNDVITDFNVGEGDTLDIAGILVGYNGVESNFVQLTQSGGNTIVSVDTNGLVGGLHFVQLAVLNGVNLGTDAHALDLAGTIVFPM